MRSPTWFRGCYPKKAGVRKTRIPAAHERVSCQSLACGRLHRRRQTTERNERRQRRDRKKNASRFRKVADKPKEIQFDIDTSNCDSWSFLSSDSDLGLFGFLNVNHHEGITEAHEISRSRSSAAPDAFQELNHRDSASSVAPIAAGVAEEEILQLAVYLEYGEDIYNYSKLAEQSLGIDDYMDSQPEMTEDTRAIIVNWMIQILLSPESLYLAVHILDRYLSMEIVPLAELQLVGASAMLIANKYEEDINTLNVSDFVYYSDSNCLNGPIVEMEKRILNKLSWEIAVPTAYVFLVKFLKDAQCDKQMEHLVFFFAELGLMEYSMTKYPPSMFAASAVYAAQCTLNKSPSWSEALENHTGYSKDQLLICTEILVSAHSTAPESDLTAVYNKYSIERFGRVALLPPATVDKWRS